MSSQETQKRKKTSKNINKAKTGEKESEKQMLMSLFEINVIRYALFIEDVRPENLDPFFLVDFMSLPDNYFHQDAVHKYGIQIIKSKSKSLNNSLKII